MWIQTKYSLINLEDVRTINLELDNENPYISIFWGGNDSCRLPCDSVKEAQDLFITIGKILEKK